MKTIFFRCFLSLFWLSCVVSTKLGGSSRTAKSSKRTTEWICGSVETHGRPISRNRTASDSSHSRVFKLNFLLCAREWSRPTRVGLFVELRIEIYTVHTRTHSFGTFINEKLQIRKRFYQNTLLVTGWLCRNRCLQLKNEQPKFKTKLRFENSRNCLSSPTVRSVWITEKFICNFNEDFRRR